MVKAPFCIFFTCFDYISSTISSIALRFFSARGQSSAMCPTGMIATASKSAEGKRRLMMSVSKLHTQQVPRLRSVAARPQMLGSYSHVDVAVLLVVVAACPALAVVLHAHDVERSSAEPIAVVRLPELFLSLLAAHHDKLPRLAVDSRRSQSDAFEDVCQVVVAYRLVSIFACREAGL